MKNYYCCERCKGPGSLSMSWFNTQMICAECQKIEQAHKDYNKAKEAVYEEERKGNRNFEGIGLPDDLKQN